VLGADVVNGEDSVVNLLSLLQRCVPLNRMDHGAVVAWPGNVNYPWAGGLKMGEDNVYIRQREVTGGRTKVM
jgi:hypothetical protein